MPKLSLPNELTNDGYFCSYTLRYFINEHIISNKLSSTDDMKVKKEENIHLILLMINRAISQGCFHFKYNKNEMVFIKACRELYLEIIRQKKTWDPTNPNCEYFKVQNQIAIGDKKASFSYIEDPNIDKDLYAQMRDSYDRVSNKQVKKIRDEMYEMFKEKGFTDSQIDELIQISIKTPNLIEAKMKEMLYFNEHFANPKYEADEVIDSSDEKIDVDSFLEELGLQ